VIFIFPPVFGLKSRSRVEEDLTVYGKLSELFASEAKQTDSEQNPRKSDCRVARAPRNDLLNWVFAQNADGQIIIHYGFRRCQGTYFP
jgi:hypothetical protein